jgi:hypothetical protein
MALVVIQRLLVQIGRQRITWAVAHAVAFKGLGNFKGHVDLQK